MPNKIFRCVLYAASVVLAGVAWRLVYLHYVQDTMMEMAERQQVTQQRQIEQLTAQARHMKAADSGRVLAANERCIGGAIVRVETVSGVPTYTQVSDGDRP